MCDNENVIYILTNKSFKENWIKIGYTNNLQKRLSELNNKTAIPFSFEVYATYQVDKELSDKNIHKILDILKPDIRSIETNDEGKERKREFFNLDPEDAYSIFEAIAEMHNKKHSLKEGEARIKKRIENEKLNENNQRAENFSFSKCGIKIGEEISWSVDPSIKAIVSDDKKVKFEGEKMSLTALAQQLLGTKKALQGPRFFKYNNELLTDFRKKTDSQE